MELEEVVNPHYAFPIVCVVVCALLVFAFGFKSPGQPPSFDAVLEEERKTTKKRKGKDGQKSKPQQNGRPGGISASNKSESGSQSNKGKPVATEKHAAKSEPKQNKKNKTSQFKKAEVGIDAFVVTPTDDNNEGEWVQQLSKKERKNRKREEIISGSINSETEKPAVNEVQDTHQNLTEQPCDSQESSPKKKGKKQQKEAEISKSGKNDILQTKAEKVSQQDVELKLEPAVKEQRTSKKKKGQKEEIKTSNATTTTTDSVSVGVCDNEETSKNIKNAENGITNQMTCPPNEEEIAQKIQDEQLEEESVPKDDPKVQLKKKKGRKKTQESTLDGYETTPDIVDAAVSTTTVENVPETTAIPETQSTNTDSSPPDIENEKNAVIQGDSNKDAQIGSNVVFDELGDIWQNPRSQKKKKRARREQ